MPDLRLSLACVSHANRNQFVFDGTVKPERIDLSLVRYSSVDDLFRRTLNNKEFDVSELSFSNYIYAQDMGIDYIAIPVFTSRKFRHRNIFVTEKSSITKPEDLDGKKVLSSPEYYVSAAIWQRGVLQHEFGVELGGIDWFVEKDERIKITFPSDVSVTLVKDGWKKVEEGEIDATIGPRRPPDHSSTLHRLFRDPKEAEMEYFRRTKIYPIMHVLVIRKSIWEENKWAATSILKAFERSKNLWTESMNGPIVTAERLSGPAWLDITIEEERETMGEDSYPYGVEKNRKTIQTLIDYCAEQAVMRKVPNVDELFAENTLDFSS